MPLTNYGVVSWYENCRLSRSAQPDAIGYQTLDRNNVSVIIKLSYDREFSNEVAARMFSSGRVLYRPLPRVFRGNCYVQVQEIVREINSLLAFGHNVHCHCRHGTDRTGLIVAAHQLIYMHRSLPDVLGERRAYGVGPLRGLLDFEDLYLLKDLNRALLREIP